MANCSFCKYNTAHHECGNACGTMYCSEECATRDWHSAHFETCIGIELKDVKPAVLQILLNTEPWNLKNVCVANKKWNAICQSDVFKRQYVHRYSKTQWLLWFTTHVHNQPLNKLANTFRVLVPWFRMCVLENIFNPMSILFDAVDAPAILIYAAGAGFEQLCKKLLWNGVSPIYRERLLTLLIATEFEQLQILELLFIHPKVMFPPASYSETSAAENGNLEIVKFFASLRYKNVDFSRNDNRMIGEAARFGHYKVVEYLLSLPAEYGIDPSANNQYCIGMAALNGHLNVIKVLMRDPRVRPEADENYALNEAAYNGHLEIVNQLLQDARVLPIIPNNAPIKNAAKNGHLEIVKLLLTRIEPNKGANDALNSALKAYKTNPSDQRLKDVIEYLQFFLRQDEEGDRKKTKLVEAELVGKKISKKKAREILHHGSVHGHPLTEQQRRYFGWLANEK